MSNSGKYFNERKRETHDTVEGQIEAEKPLQGRVKCQLGTVPFPDIYVFDAAFLHRAIRPPEAWILRGVSRTHRTTTSTAPLEPSRPSAVEMKRARCAVRSFVVLHSRPGSRQLLLAPA